MTAPRVKPERICVLLDGDADFFNLSLLSQGHIGGRLAAEQLQSRIGSLWASPQLFELHCMVFWNLAGLSSYLAFTDQLPSHALQAFGQGFSTSDDGVSSAVDTGGGKQAADRAIKRHLNLFLPLFDHFYLGGTHDAGYAPFLSSLGNGAEKITLLQTTPAFSPALQELGMKTVDTRGWELFDGRDPNNGRRHEMHKAQPKAENQTAEVLETYPGLPLPFVPLISHLIHLASLGNSTPPLSDVLGYLGSRYHSPAPLFSTLPPGPTTWNEYVHSAQLAGLVEVGGRTGVRWIKLRRRDD